MRCCILYNPLAGGGRGLINSERFAAIMPKHEFICQDITKIKDFGPFLHSIGRDTPLIICGGDGTLNHFANRTGSIKIRNPIYVYASGNANDFLRDLEENPDRSAFRINEYLENLPVVTVKGRDYRFLNGIFCGNAGSVRALHILLSKSGSSMEERIKAFNTLVFKSRSCSATVEMDGKKHSYRKVWMAPTANGRFLSGGMCPVPEQDRFSESGKISTLILYGCGRLKGLISAHAMFRGQTDKFRSQAEVLTGHDVSVSFDRPVELQIDGETLSGVSGYRVRSPAMIKKAFSVRDCLPEKGPGTISAL